MPPTVGDAKTRACIHCCFIAATIAAADASLWLACYGGPIDRPIADRKASMSSRPITAAASRNTCLRSHQRTVLPHTSAALARAWRYITKSAIFAARVSVIRSSIVGRSFGQIGMAILAFGTGNLAANSSRRARRARSLHTPARPAPLHRRAKLPVPKGY
jgi:hypothetical protein